MTVLHRPAHGVTIRQVFEGRRRGHLPALRRLLEEGEDLDPRLIDEVQRQILLATN